jgi:GTPase SAR1 family protein
MGQCTSVEGKRASSSNRVVLFLGLDGAGSTTMLYQLLLGRHLQTIPTLGNNHETVCADGMELDCWDIGGLEKMRHLWVQYSLEADGVVFVVDSTDPGRFAAAAKELRRVFAKEKTESDDEDPAGDEDDHKHEPKKHVPRRHTPIAELPLLVFANKQDLEGAESVEDVTIAMHISSLPCKYTHVAPCSAMDLASLQAGLKWMTDHFKAVSTGGRKPTAPGSPVSQ